MFYVQSLDRHYNVGHDQDGPNMVYTAKHFAKKKKNYMLIMDHNIG